MAVGGRVSPVEALRDSGARRRDGGDGLPEWCAGEGGAREVEGVTMVAGGTNSPAEIIRRLPLSPGKKFRVEALLEDNDGDEERGTHHGEHSFHRMRGHASGCQGGGRDESDPPGESDHFP
jgi:hypothetical protein